MEPTEQGPRVTDRKQLFTLRTWVTSMTKYPVMFGAAPASMFNNLPFRGGEGGSKTVNWRSNPSSLKDEIWGRQSPAHAYYSRNPHADLATCTAAVADQPGG